VRVVPPFYQDPGYIDALVAVARPYLECVDHLLFSFHGVPERHIHKSDPTGSSCLKKANCCHAHAPKPAHATCYRHQCYVTAQRFVETAGVREQHYSVAFQSRLGRDEWLKPATDQHLRELALAGVRRLGVICPSFTADCLETLEEIGLRGRETFVEAGGKELVLIPCLNSEQRWAEQVARLAERTSPKLAPALS